MSSTTSAPPSVSIPPARVPAVRLVSHPLLGQLARYAAASGLGTAVNIAVYLTARLWWDSLAANLVALLLSTALSTELNRRFTFGHTGARGWPYYAQTAATVIFYAFYSSAVLLVLHLAVTETVPIEESAAVTAASLLGGTVRFAILRNWVFRQVALGSGRVPGRQCPSRSGCPAASTRTPPGNSRSSTCSPA